MRPAMLLGRAREIRTSRRCRAARPQQVSPSLDLGCEDLVLEVPEWNTESLRHLDDALCLGNVACERLFAGDSLERTTAAFDRDNDLLEVLDPRVVWPGHPDRVDRWIGDHVGDRRIRLCVAD